MLISDLGCGHVHFIGVGGISMSGLAEILKKRGCTVSGSDLRDSHITRKLSDMGITCYQGHKAGQEAGANLVVYTSAIAKDNPELVSAKRNGIELMERAELLGQIMQEHRLAVGISGMHGKTTCTSMLVTLLYYGGFDPTAHIGSELPLIGGTTRVGSDDIMVAEACEYKDNFLKLSPNIEIILNIDRDHLDYFRDLEHIQSSFQKYVAKLGANDLLIINGDDENCRAVHESARCRSITFGFTEPCGLQAFHLEPGDNGCYSFEFHYLGRNYKSTLSVPGKHNVLNALAAMAAAAGCGMDMKTVAKLISRYEGATRRFEHAGKTERGAQIYHDYAHHPAEVRATLEAARTRFPDANITCIFQPHTYTRTKALFEDFAVCFQGVKTLILLDIYAAREQDPGDINAVMLKRRIEETGTVENCLYAKDFSEAAHMARVLSGDHDIILTLGAGDIEGLSAKIAQGQMIRKEAPI